ncbi:TPA: DUF4976 domain-containing protein [Candidatus Poribacteria bacterium]|nr:DUF4976 domain-containing protein [Candidatus Poribacteria bacterium]
MVQKKQFPNIIFFMVDQLAAKWLEISETGICDLPNIQRLKSGGTSFSNAITSNPVCCAARSTLATGLTSRGHGVLENGYQLDPDLPTFMRTLQESGWRTGAFGKVHLNPHFGGLYPDYHRYGFDVTHITEDARGGEWLDWVESEHPQHYQAVLATIWPTEIPKYAAYSRKRNLQDRIKAIRQNFDWTTPEFPDSTPGAYALPFPEEVSQTCWITMHALNFLRETPIDQPCYAHISYVQPHSPFCAPADYIHRIDPLTLPSPVPAEWESDPHAPAYFSGKTPVKPNWQLIRRNYFADLMHLDHQLGQVLDLLETQGRDQNTYIVFLSDHGELLADHGFTGKEERHYDACIRVSLIVTGPGLRQGQICDDLVQLEDICPAVLEIANQSFPPMPRMGPYLKVEAEDLPQLPGKSLLPLCRGERLSDWRTAAYRGSYNAIRSVNPGDWAQTIRTDQYRYTIYPKQGGQLFDLQKDPDEQRNLVADPDYLKIRQELQYQLMELIILQVYPKTRRSLFALGVH